MLRVLAFVHQASEQLHFGKGLSTEDEPDLWAKNLRNEIDLWIDVGLPDEKHVRRACGRAKQVCIYCYGGHRVESWWHQHQRRLKQLDKLAVYNVPEAGSKALVGLVERTMHLQCTIQDGEVMFADGENTVELMLQVLKVAV